NDLQITVIHTDFHREKAWTEWVTKKDHGVYESRQHVLSMLRKIALAASFEDHQKALGALTESHIWHKSDTLRQWFSNKWLPEIKKWAPAYRTGELHVGIHTNNGLERQNEVLKHTYLEGYKNRIRLFIHSFSDQA
ncbi:hedgehog interacting, partial [Pelobates cultripes]